MDGLLFQSIYINYNLLSIFYIINNNVWFGCRNI